MKELLELMSVPVAKYEDIQNIVVAYDDGVALTIAIEELAELIQSLTKYKRYGWSLKTVENINEEVADVLICLTELYANGLINTDAVQAIQKYKIDRELGRIKKKEVH